MLLLLLMRVYTAERMYTAETTTMFNAAAADAAGSSYIHSMTQINWTF